MKLFLFTNLIFALFLSPLLFGITNRTKAIFSGRKGQPFLQTYYDIWKLLKKDFVYSKTITWIFKINPLINLISMLIVLLFIPLNSIHSALSFNGDILIVLYFLALARFFMVISALDTGSSFEGMGASREIIFSIFTEFSFFSFLIALIILTSSLSFSIILTKLGLNEWASYTPPLIILTISFIIIALAENCRMPFDDPNTHLELTMIHEVMMLDYTGPDLGILTYSSTLKYWIFSSIFSCVLVPNTFNNFLLEIIAGISGIFIFSIIIGVLESILTRIKLLNFPNLIMGSGILSLLALMLIKR